MEINIVILNDEMRILLMILIQVSVLIVLKLVEQNEQTLYELFDHLSRVEIGGDSYQNLNRLANVFAKFVLDNRQLYFLLYNFHFRNGEYKFSYSYKRILLKVINFANRDFANLFSALDKQRKKTMRKVLLLSLSGLSVVLDSEPIQKKILIDGQDLVQIFLNVFLAGTSVLEEM